MVLFQQTRQVFQIQHKTCELSRLATASSTLSSTLYGLKESFTSTIGFVFPLNDEANYESEISHSHNRTGRIYVYWVQEEPYRERARKPFLGGIERVRRQA